MNRLKVLVAGFVMTALTLGGMQAYETYRDTSRDCAPDGWEIVTDGDEFRFREPDGYLGLFPKGSEREAIRAAWAYYDYLKEPKSEIDIEYEKAKTRTWVGVDCVTNNE